jgi:2-polyprenyl-6-methoxyphenol hydroxylase-like FAD-dependent oxidoreductase
MIAHSGRAEKVSAGIVGGGIGGLTAALSLLRRGFDVHVYEQAPMLIEVGPASRSAPTHHVSCTDSASPPNWRGRE